MQSVGELRWRVTSPEPCPHFHAQLHVDLSLAAASRCVTGHRILLFPPPFSSCGDDRSAVGLVHPHGNPVDHVHGEIAQGGAAGFSGSSPNMSSGKRQIERKDGTGTGIRCISSPQNSLHSTCIPYRIMPACFAERVPTTRSLIKFMAASGGSLLQSRRWVLFPERRRSER
jgi:hypothetical protein